MNGFGDHFRLRYCRRIQCCSPPGYVQRHPREVDDATVAAIATQIVRGTHENTIHRAGLNAQRAEHTFAVIYGVARNLKPFAAFYTFFTDVDAIDGASFSALIA